MAARLVAYSCLLCGDVCKIHLRRNGEIAFSLSAVGCHKDPAQRHRKIIGGCYNHCGRGCVTSADVQLAAEIERWTPVHGIGNAYVVSAPQSLLHDASAKLEEDGPHHHRHQACLRCAAVESYTALRGNVPLFAIHADSCDSGHREITGGYFLQRDLLSPDESFALDDIVGSTSLFGLGRAHCALASAAE